MLALGRRLWSWPVGLAAALLAAVSPYLVWYSQEVRMYCLAALWGLLLVWLTLDRAEGMGGRAAVGGWVGWIAVAAAALYTQYFVGGSVVAIANVIALLAVLRAWRVDHRFPSRFAIRWIGVQVVVLVLFVPWLTLAWPAIRDWPALGPPVGAGFIAREGLATFALGSRVPPAASLWLPVMVALAAAGLLVRGRGGSRWAPLVGLVYTAVPLLLMGLMSLTRPAWNPKFLIAGAPGFELLAGAGLVGIAAGAAALVRAQPGAAVPVTANAGTAGVPPARPRDKLARIVGFAAAGILLLLIFAPRLQTLAATYFDPAYQRDDYRGIAAQIAAEAGPDDAVILDAPTQIEVFDYYNRGKVQTFPLPLERPADRAATLARLEEIGRTHRDIYAVLWATGESDPEGIVEGWLNANRYKVLDEWHGNVRLALWAAERGPMMRRPDLDPARFRADILASSGNDFFLGDIALGPMRARPGDNLTVFAKWVAMSHSDTDFVVFVQLLDAKGRLVAQRDMPPGGGAGRTSTLTPGAVIEDRIGLHIPVDLAPGDYELVIGLYDPATGERLPMWQAREIAGDAFSLGTVTVVAP